MRETTLTSASLAELLAAIEREPGAGRYIFRGQGDAKWKLVPGLYRLDDAPITFGTIEKFYDDYEEKAISLFFAEGFPYLPSIERNTVNERIIAQHFGVPTKLLDWSHDPLVALFFAVEDWRRECDSAVFMIVPNKDSRSRNDSPLRMHDVVTISPPAIDRRIPSQKSIFTIHMYGDPDLPFVPLDERDEVGDTVLTADDSLKRGFAKITIPNDFKIKIMKGLLGLGIDRRNLFPGLDGVGSDIAERMKINMMAYYSQATAE